MYPEILQYSEKHITTCVIEFILETENVGIRENVGISSLNINIGINLLYSEKSIVLNWALTWIKIFKTIYLKRERKKKTQQ